MNISKLEFGTKLMWEAHSRIMDNKTGEISPITYVYPATIGEKHFNREWVKVITNRNSSWMGPDSQYLRLPTEEELNTLTWPEAIY